MPPTDTRALDTAELEVLRDLGFHWGGAVGDRAQWERVLPVDPHLRRETEEIRARRLGRFVSVGDASAHVADVEATEETGSPSHAGRLWLRLRRLVLGPPLRSTAIAAERIRKLVALPVLSADALSSVAYGPQAMLGVVVLAGSGGLALSLPIAGAIAFLMLAVGISYRQTIRAYPHGGGSYIVASDNLGRVPGLMAAAGLMTDYVLTVAVSVAAGIAAITSAIPSLSAEIVPLGLGAIALLLAGNLRGVRQAGSLFALPTYAFILAVFVLVAVGLGQAAGRGFTPSPHPALAVTEGVGLMLVLRAFSSGATAMTGIEAISNAVPVFKPPGWRNARTTLTWMVGLLVALFAGVVVLVQLDGVVPTGNETVLSQLAHRSFGSGPLYAYTQAATAAVLLLAANTAFNDFPRVLSIMARDSSAPRMFLHRGDRLAFNNGIVALAVAAAAVLVAFGGKTDALIPLYAVGVFLAFALSQTGMVVHWRRHRDAHWRRSMFINGLGAALSAIVFLIAGITKFTAGAWLAIVVVGTIVIVCLRIRRHYEVVRKAVALRPGAVEIPQQLVEPAGGNGRVSRPESEAEKEQSPEEIRHLTVVALSALDLPGLRALAYAASLRQPLLALHISTDEEQGRRFEDDWHAWGNHLPLELVNSPYRAIVAPMIDYIQALRRQRPDLTLTVILPELVVRHWWQRSLHSQTAPRLRRALRPLPKIVITTVPFHLPA
jgi:amino acid transporter